MPQMLDPNFSRTVVLLCKHGDDGAFGLVVNRPLVTSGLVTVNLDPPVSTERELCRPRRSCCAGCSNRSRRR